MKSDMKLVRLKDNLRLDHPSSFGSKKIVLLRPTGRFFFSKGRNAIERVAAGLPGGFRRARVGPFGL